MTYADAIDLILKSIGVVSSIAAAIAIPVTLRMTWRTHKQRAVFDMIDKMYSLCHVLHDHVAKNWRVSHLFAITDELYTEVAARVRDDCKPSQTTNAVTATPPIVCMQQLIEDERNFAIRVFITYEQVFYQWKHTDRQRHPERWLFLDEMLRYFTDRLLRNRRLLAYLAAASDDNGSQVHLERDSTRHLIDRIGRDSLTANADMQGPFGFDPRLDRAKSTSA